LRNVFIEGPPEKFEGARLMIEAIVADHRRIQENFSLIGEVNPFPGPYTYFAIPNAITGSIIGAQGSAIKSLYQKTGCYIFIPQDVTSKNERVLQLSGTFDQITKCKQELLSIMSNSKQTEKCSEYKPKHELASTGQIALLEKNK